MELEVVVAKGEMSNVRINAGVVLAILNLARIE
jgi:hypothetical protein